MKANIIQLKKDITDAKVRQDEASKDVKRIERDMKDFDNNKDSKLAELQVSIHHLLDKYIVMLMLIRHP
jgi:structural maintenance of chromosome 2